MVTMDLTVRLERTTMFLRQTSPAIPYHPVPACLDTLEQADPHVPATRDEPLRRKLQGLLLYRLLMAVFFLLLSLGVQSHREADLLAAHLRPLYFFSCILFSFTILASWALRFVQKLQRFAYFQLFFDVGAVTVVIFISGGVESFFSFLYMPVIISAAVLLTRRGSILIASSCSVAYGLLLDSQYFNWISPLQFLAPSAYTRDSGSYFLSILMNTASFYLVAFLSGYLAEELRKSSRKVKEQERDLHQLEILHRNIVHSMNSGLLTINSNGQILFCNRAAMEILALPVEQVEGRSFDKVFPPLEGMPWLREASAPFLMTSPGLERLETSYVRPSGEEICLGYTISRLHKANGEPSGWVIIFQDLTHLKAMEEHLKRMERLTLAGTIAAEIAHEIKNPLAAMSGAVQMLQLDAPQGSQHSRLMGIVSREIHRINDLVTDFLWLSKGARKSDKTEKVALCPVIQEILCLLKARSRVTETHNIQTDFEVMPTYTMDSQHLRQIIWNLLTNALEAMPDGGDLSIRVSPAYGRKDGKPETRIDIQDTGPGICREVRERIFEPFFTTKKTGTGLGLSIVYQMVENAGGRIEVASEDPGGTTFSLFFPS
ncbi:MAG: PAS domain S-box protein [Deltaproteobacteria bacterium]|nr:PAS domain S-box protein [Deltaproteobacteria bacterium]